MDRVSDFCFLAILICAALCPLADAGEAEWIEITSPHFLVVTDAGERRGRDVITRFEQMRVLYSTLTSNATVNLPVPLEIVAFRNTKEFRQVAPLWNGKPVQLAGLFQPGQDRCFIMLDMSVENSWNAVFHEYAHQLMNGNLTLEVDPWFEEGFAEYFSTIEVDGREARMGKIDPVTYQIVRQDGLMKVSDLFRVQHNSAAYNENGDRRTVFYAESALVVHYLFEHQMIPKLAAYFEFKLDKKVPVEEAIQRGFGITAANFDKEIWRYVESGHYQYFTTKTPVQIETRNYVIRSLTANSANAVIGDIHLHSRDYHEKAMEEFDAVLKVDPDNTIALRGMGYAYLQKRDFEEAADYFQRAAHLDAKDARLHYYSGLLMNLRGTRVTQTDLDFTINELKTAIALDPDFADAYMQLAIAQSRSGDLNAALISARKAISLNTRNQNYYFNLADLYMQQRQTDDAINIFRALSKSSDKTVALRATAALDQVELMEKEMREMRTAPVSVDSREPETSPRPPVTASTPAQTPSSTDKKPEQATARMGPMEITTDTRGVDFGPYLQRVLHDIKRNWYNLIPQAAMPPLLKKGKLSIEFAITKNGQIAGLRYLSSSGDVAFDRAAYGGITASNPFPPLPQQFAGPYLGLRMTFFYNPDPIYQPDQNQRLTRQNQSLTGISPPRLQVPAGTSAQFVPILNGITDHTKFPITWSVVGDCAAATCGTISESGMYTAPLTVPIHPIILVKAKADAVNESYSAVVTIVPSDPSQNNGQH